MEGDATAHESRSCEIVDTSVYSGNTRTTQAATVKKLAASITLAMHRLRLRAQPSRQVTGA